MAGTLVANTINTDTGLFSTQNAYSGIAKAWVNYNSTGTPAIRSSFNVSSMTRASAGTFTINFATAMSDANYSMTSSTVYTSGTGDIVMCALDSRTAQTTSALPIVTYGSVNAYEDKTYINVAVFGN